MPVRAVVVTMSDGSERRFADKRNEEYVGGDYELTRGTQTLHSYEVTSDKTLRIRKETLKSTKDSVSDGWRDWEVAASEEVGYMPEGTWSFVEVQEN